MVLKGSVQTEITYFVQSLSQFYYVRLISFRTYDKLLLMLSTRNVLVDSWNDCLIIFSIFNGAWKIEMEYDDDV